MSSALPDKESAATKSGALPAASMDLPQHLPRPGLVGILIRLTLGLATATIAYDAIRYAPAYWDGFDDLAGSAWLFAILVLLSSWVLNELLQKRWGQRPTLVLLGGAAATIGVGSLSGDPFGPIFGAYIWAWALAFSLLLFPAHLLAALLRTPGCEMRSYAHLRAKVSGGDVETVVCPGWIDRCDGVRLFGRL